MRNKQIKKKSKQNRKRIVNENDKRKKRKKTFSVDSMKIDFKVSFLKRKTKKKKTSERVRKKEQA